MEQEETEETEGIFLGYLGLLRLNAPKIAVFALMDGVFGHTDDDHVHIIVVLALMDGVYALMDEVYEGIFGVHESMFGVYGGIFAVNGDMNVVRAPINGVGTRIAAV